MSNKHMEKYSSESFIMKMLIKTPKTYHYIGTRMDKKRKRLTVKVEVRTQATGSHHCSWVCELPHSMERTVCQYLGKLEMCICSDSKIPHPRSTAQGNAHTCAPQDVCKDGALCVICQLRKTKHQLMVKWIQTLWRHGAGSGSQKSGPAAATPTATNLHVISWERNQK